MSKQNIFIEGEHIYLKEVQMLNATATYCSWLNDPCVNMYLDSSSEKWTVRKLKHYIETIKKDNTNCFWAIYRKDTNSYIGNIKLGFVDIVHKHGDVGILIGERSSWGMGFATEAIQLVKKFAFTKLKLHKLTAGSYSKNYGSIRAFQKAGFHIEGIRKQQRILNGRYVDQVLLGCIKGKCKINK